MDAYSPRGDKDATAHPSVDADGRDVGRGGTSFQASLEST